jgi:hypothetical protein
LLTLYGGLRAQGIAARKKFEAERVLNTKPSLALEKYAGTYSDSLHGSRLITMENGKLRMRYSATYGATLEHWQYDTFLARPDQRWVDPDVVTFVIGNGVPLRLEIDGVAFTRVKSVP